MTSSFSYSNQGLAEAQERETAHERARGHLTELRRQILAGAGFSMILPLLDQLEADHNTYRPQHAGWAERGGVDQNPTAPVTTPTGLAGNPFEPASDNAAVYDADGNLVAEPKTAEEQRAEVRREQATPVEVVTPDVDTEHQGE